MKRFKKVYLEISNICNLSCAFCPGTKRAKRAMSEEEFESLMPMLKPYTDFLYFHLMGEPLCHPRLERLLEIAYSYGFKVILTTNGTLLRSRQDMLLSAKGLHKVNISLHAFEANDLAVPFDEYLNSCFEFGKTAEGKLLVVYRLWNHGGAEAENGHIIDVMKKHFTSEFAENTRGARIGERVYLDYGDKFDWPSLEAAEGEEGFGCYGLRDQIGILCDGSVVPCCLDHEGDITLGNIFKEELASILETKRAKAIYEGFKNSKAIEPLCKRCGYARKMFL